jgi:hypothetical protein
LRHKGRAVAAKTGALGFKKTGSTRFGKLARELTRLRVTCR